MVDITERKTVEGALAASERQFRSIFDAAAIGVMTVGLDGRILEANPTLEQVCDYPSGALHGQTLPDYLEPDRLQPGAVRRARRRRRATAASSSTSSAAATAR